jgi:hypothetical protein
MADTKISALPAASAALGADELAINEAGTSKKLTVTQIQTLIGGGTITTQDEGGALSATVTTLNFVGAGVTASGAGATTTVTIPGASSGSLGFAYWRAGGAL